MWNREYSLQIVDKKIAKIENNEKVVQKIVTLARKNQWKHF
jgi:hypothetical protein